MLHRNPWERLPAQPPFIAHEDCELLARYPDLAQHLRLEFLPVPFMGAADAEVVLLSLNPSATTDDYRHGPSFVEERRRGLRFESRYPFLGLDPAFAATGGYEYWNRRLRELIDRVGREALARRLLVVQYFPYQSPTWHEWPAQLPSQTFGFDLVRRAISAGSEIVVMRSRRRWLAAVPELATVRFIELRSPRSAYVTPGNMGQDAFERVVDRLTRAAR